MARNKRMKIGDIIELQKQDVEVEECQKCEHLMVNIDAGQIKQGDLVTLKRKKVRVSNPDTKDPICLKCDIEKEKSFGEKLSEWWESDDDDDDDSDFFTTSIPRTPTISSSSRSSYTPSRTSSTPSFGGSSSFGGFRGSFGGFSGGGFSGGGISRSF